MLSVAIRFLYRLLKAALALTLILAMAWFFREPIFRASARAWVVDDSPTHADALVVLGGGREWRPFASAELYKAGISQKILVAQVETLRSEQAISQPSETEVNLAILAQQGIPRDRVETFGTNVTSTKEEADSLRSWILANHATSVLIPTDPFHTRRAKWILERQLADTGVTVYVKAVDHPRYSVDRWWEKEEGFLTFQNELLKSVYYLVKY